MMESCKKRHLIILRRHIKAHLWRVKNHGNQNDSKNFWRKYKKKIETFDTSELVWVNQATINVLPHTCNSYRYFPVYSENYLLRRKVLNSLNYFFGIDFRSQLFHGFFEWVESSHELFLNFVNIFLFCWSGFRFSCYSGGCFYFIKLEINK